MIPSLNCLQLKNIAPPMEVVQNVFSDSGGLDNGRNVKKIEFNYFPPKKATGFRRAVSAWLKRISMRTPGLLSWAEGMVQDSDVFGALLELVCWRQLDGTELLEFLEEQRATHVSARELRTELRQLGKRWKQVEKLAAKALQESDSYLGELGDMARGIEQSARLLSKFFIAPVRKRPLEAEIADCKHDILHFLRKRRVGEVNEYGWILLRAVFERRWKAGKGRDQIEAFRSVPKPFRGTITNRKEAELVMERAKIDIYRMRNIKTGTMSHVSVPSQELANGRRLSSARS